MRAMSASFTVRSTRHRRPQKATGYIWTDPKPMPGDNVELWSRDERDSAQRGTFVRWNRNGKAIVKVG